MQPVSWLPKISGMDSPPEIVEMIVQEQGLQATPENYLAAAEGYSEENYNQIDGRMDT